MTGSSYMGDINKPTPSDFKFGTIDPDYALGNPKVLFDGESTISSKQYNYLDTYSPVAGQRVLLVKVNGKYIILGGVI